MDKILTNITESLINKIGCDSEIKSFDLKLINKFYFENITDSQFFNICGLKDSFVDFYSNIAKNGVKTIIFGGF